MKRLLPIPVLALLTLPATAQIPAAQPAPAPQPAVSHEALQAEQTRDEALIQSQHDQIAGLTRQMQDLKAQLDALQRELGFDEAATGQAGERVSQASKQKYGVRVGR